MLLKTILNRVQKFKSFIYGSVKWVDTGKDPELDIELLARANSKPICSVCGRQASGYDPLPERRFEFIPMWGASRFFRYAPRRVDCCHCGVHVEQLPWSKGKRRLTESCAWFLSDWAKRLSWKETAEVFHTTWDHVFCSVEMAVNWGKKNRHLTDIKAIGVDEIQWQRGHKYLTLVYQIDSDCRRLLWAGQNRTIKTLLKYFRGFGKVLRRHKPLLMNGFKAKGPFSSGVVEGFNNKAKLTTRKAYGLRTYYAAEVTLFHTLGALPVPETAHKFF